jgi:hypothetical protein
VLIIIIRLFVSVKHVGISATEELEEVRPHVLLLIDVLNLHGGFRHKVLDQRITVVLAHSAQLTHYLISKEIDSFLRFVELLGFGGEHEGERKFFGVDKVVLATNQFYHFTFIPPSFNILFE